MHEGFNDLIHFYFQILATEMPCSIMAAAKLQGDIVQELPTADYRAVDLLISQIG